VTIILQKNPNTNTASPAKNEYPRY